VGSSERPTGSWTHAHLHAQLSGQLICRMLKEILGVTLLSLGFKAKQRLPWGFLHAQVPFLPVYAAHLRNIIKREVNRVDDYDHPLEGYHIVVDAGNGSGGFVATDVLRPLGADISGGCPPTPHAHPMPVPVAPCHVAMARSTAALPHVAG
jgi:phosphomannomutase